VGKGCKFFIRSGGWKGEGTVAEGGKEWKEEKVRKGYRAFGRETQQPNRAYSSKKETERLLLVVNW